MSGSGHLASPFQTSAPTFAASGNRLRLNNSQPRPPFSPFGRVRVLLPCRCWPLSRRHGKLFWICRPTARYKEATARVQAKTGRLALYARAAACLLGRITPHMKITAREFDDTRLNAGRKAPASGEVRAAVVFFERYWRERQICWGGPYSAGDHMPPISRCSRTARQTDRAPEDPRLGSAMGSSQWFPIPETVSSEEELLRG